MASHWCEQYSHNEWPRHWLMSSKYCCDQVIKQRLQPRVQMQFYGRLDQISLRRCEAVWYRTTEITLREVDTRHISLKTMECFDHRWLYFLRVVVDVTGHLGEYISRGMVVRICSGVCCPVDEGLKRGICRHHRDM